jgi:heme-degrading monooxygenase HmoA
MFSVIFEVQPKHGKLDQYLNLAKELKPILESIEGFIDNERFESKRTAGRILSLSTWRDEKAVIRWRTVGRHHEIQEKGRFEVFEDYHLRVGEITADTHVPRQNLQEQRFDETEVGEAKMVSITEVTPAEGEKPPFLDNEMAERLGVPAIGAGDVLDQEIFESIYNPGKLLLLVSWRIAAAAQGWHPPAPIEGVNQVRNRLVRIIRDYGMSDRREAPQFYPEIERMAQSRAEPPTRTETRASLNPERKTDLHPTHPCMTEMT